MNKKLIRNIILSILAIAILGFGYYFAVKWNPDEESDKTETPKEVQAIWNLNTDDINSVDISNEYGEYTVTKEENDYKITGLDDYKLDGISTLMMQLSGLTYEKSINETDKSPYGLDTPCATADIKLKDGEKTLYIGDKTPTNDGYYVMADDKIYVVMAGYVSSVLNAKEDFISKSIAEVETDSVKGFELYRNNELIAAFETNTDSELYSDYVMTKPMQGAATDNFSKFLEKLPKTVTANKIISTNINDAEKYHIGKTSIKIIGDKEEHIIKFGDKTDDGEVYAVYEGEKLIFTMDSTISDELLMAKASDYISKIIYLQKIDDVSEIEYNSPKGKFVLKIQRNGDQETYTINDKAVEEDPFKEAYRNIMGVLFTEGYSDGSIGEKKGSIVYKMTNGTTKTVEFYDYNERNYVAKNPDGVQYVLLKQNFDDVYDMIKSNIE